MLRVISLARAKTGAVVFVGGFFILWAVMQWTGFQGRKHAAIASESLFPSALKLQEADMEFQSMTRRHKDAVLLEDRTALASADNLAGTVLSSLNEAGKYLGCCVARQQEIRDLEYRVARFQHLAHSRYTNFIEHRGTPEARAEAELADVANRATELQASLSGLEARVTADFRSELQLINKWSRRQQFASFGILVALACILLITAYTVLDALTKIRADEALRVAHAETELLLNSVPSILIGLDTSGTISRWNSACATIFGLSASEVAGRTLGTCGIRWLASDVDAQISAQLNSPDTTLLTNLQFEMAGGRRFVDLHALTVTASDRTTAGVLVVGADVTERRVLEDHLRQAQKLEAIGQLAAGVAHEINTPTQFVGDNLKFLRDAWADVSCSIAEWRKLQPVRVLAGGNGNTNTWSSCIDDQELDYLLEEVPRALDQSLEGLQRVAKIVQAMKEFSHPGSETKKSVHLNRAVETTVTVARNECKYVADVELQLDPGLPPVPCVAAEINQVVLNLLLNAAQAIGERLGREHSGKGKITISTHHDGEWVEIRIRDTGMGIPESIRGRIFEPFFTTKEVGKGTGQGLAMAHRIVVAKHGGRIWFDSETGKGTTFYVRLPLEDPGSNA